MTAPPARPRLATHALVRLHVIDGEERVIVHDVNRGRVCAIGPREWSLLACCDGTRDQTGILLAARARGLRISDGALDRFLGELGSADLLADGPAPFPTPVSGTDPGMDRPLDVLPGYRFQCDGRGGCCGTYASVLFSAHDVLRARSLCPDVRDGARDPTRAFTPAEGSSSEHLFASTLVDGHCAYLGGGGRCGIHAAGGGSAKPLACQLFPVSFADDGEAVRVSISPECACVFASVGSENGEPLMPTTATTRRDLPLEACVDVVPERVAVATGTLAGRSELAAWSRALSRATVRGDVAAATWTIADTVERNALEPARSLAAMESPVKPATDGLSRWIEALAVRAAGRAREDRTWRSERDLTRCVSDALADACAILLVPGALVYYLSAACADEVAEGFYLRAYLHGHMLVRDVPLTAALRDAGVRIIVSRALRTVLTRSERLPRSITAQPLALVESILRGHGLSAYVNDVES